jgi:hypothetical protein
VLQQLSVSFGVSAAAVLLSLVSSQSHALTTARFHEVFLLTAIIPLLSVPGFLVLKPQDGIRTVASQEGSPQKAVAEAETQT